SQSIGFCPDDGLVYHTAGSESYSNNPLRQGHDQGGPTIFGVGYQDSQYMETIDLQTRTFTAIFNCDPCPNPDPTLPCFGLVAPRPSWVRPTERRNSTQTGALYRERGVDEYHAVRGLSWSDGKKAFYAADENGVFRITPTGDSKFVSRPGFPADGSLDSAKAIMVIPGIALNFPPGGGDPLDAFGGVLGLAQHPVSGVIYAVRHTASAVARELV